MKKTAVATPFELSAYLIILFSIGGAAALVSSASRSEDALYSLENKMDLHRVNPEATLPQPQPLIVPLTLISSAIASSKGAVCLDGTLPGYHLDQGFGSGADNWLIQLEIMIAPLLAHHNCKYLTERKEKLKQELGHSGGGWCNTIRSCVFRKTTRRGSSKNMEKVLPFTGILSNKAEENPDFFNWNRIKLRYCDGASFSGNSENKDAQLFFRGQQIWLAAMEEFMSLGLNKAKQALLSGCSAGGLASILHCDEFRDMLPHTTKVKCLSDAGMFLDAIDVSGGRTLRAMYDSVVKLQGLQNYLPKTCTSHLDATSCFFPQNLIADIQTPLFLLNTAYDSWQVQASLAPPSADPRGYWSGCKSNHALCNTSQIQYFQGFRNQMLQDIKEFSSSKQNGLFINSCFAHCQTERQDTWFASDGPTLNNKGIAKSVGDWYFDRTGVKEIDCPYPCDKTCHNLIFN